jgi:hypothetical protein
MESENHCEKHQVEVWPYNQREKQEDMEFEKNCGMQKVV